MKDVRTQGGGGVASADILWAKGFSDSDVHTFFVQKLRIFFKIYYSAWTKGEGVNFSRFCEDVFYGQPLNSFRIKIAYVA